MGSCAWIFSFVWWGFVCLLALSPQRNVSAFVRFMVLWTWGWLFTQVTTRLFNFGGDARQALQHHVGNSRQPMPPLRPCGWMAVALLGATHSLEGSWDKSCWRCTAQMKFEIKTQQVVDGSMWALPFLLGEVFWWRITRIRSDDSLILDTIFTLFGCTFSETKSSPRKIGLFFPKWK